MPRAAPRAGERDALSLRAGKTPVSIRIVPTLLQMKPLLPQYALQHELELRRQHRAERDGRITVDRRFAIPLRFRDVRLERRLPAKVGGRKFLGVRFLPVTWNLQNACQLRFVDLTFANSCFSFV
ncbi:uncharacterized protein Tco025E_01359 [Trypanosoma conorhini]|uniref:Uncharacterized protein n=1 Tax=Trypanosoma conorhini TaxID=83891 RepID=A0A422Q9H6_9TRYP|nr:uncharacterized protein Tco025E_01359 [Trypanosoma conorhini]RNF26589.1 hypothetical protein Tco025E_01359 [Trypanosoma conorhini]